MSVALPLVQSCCASCPPVSTTGSSQPPAPAPHVAEGHPGSDGINAFNYLSASFKQPAVLAVVTAAAGNTDFLAVGQVAFVQTGGYYKVISTPNSLSVVLQNLGYDGNAVAGSTIANGSKLSPGGLQGPPGDPAPDVMQVFFNSGDPNGVVTALRPALCYGPTGEVWIKTGAGTTNTGWTNIIAAP